MNCRQAKLEIALCVGEDLTDAGRREKLRGHLTGCAECRTHFKRLKGMFQVLEHAEAQQTYDSADSLWPGLSGRLGQPRPRLQGPRFNGWVPFSVMAAACVLLMIVMEMQPTGDTVISSSLGRGMFGAGVVTGQDAPARPAETDARTSPTEPAIFAPSRPNVAPLEDDRPDTTERTATTSSF